LICLMLAACSAAPLRDQEAVKLVNPGMSAADVRAAVGPSYRQAAYAGGTSSWTYKYKDSNISKLMHVIFGPEGRVLRVETEWDPDVYSKKP
jgi:hypothetical protein